MPCCWRGHGMPPAVPSQVGSINHAFVALQPCSNPWNPDDVQWFGLREAASVRPLAQNGHRFSGRGAGIGGTKGSKMVPWVLLFFFGQLIRVFQLQHHGTLLSGHASQRQLCSRWASIFSYDASTAAVPSHIVCGMAGGCFASVNIFLEFVDASKGVLSRSHAFPTLTCVPVLTAYVCRARATVGRPAPRCRAGLRRHRTHFFRRRRRRCGRRQRPLSQPPRYGNPLPASTSLFWYFFQRTIGAAPPLNV